MRAWRRNRETKEGRPSEGGQSLEDSRAGGRAISETIWPGAHLVSGRQSHDAPRILMTSFRRRLLPTATRRYDETTTDESSPSRPVILQASSLPAGHAQMRQVAADGRRTNIRILMTASASVSRRNPHSTADA